MSTPFSLLFNRKHCSLLCLLSSLYHTLLPPHSPYCLLIRMPELHRGKENQRERESFIHWLTLSWLQHSGMGQAATRSLELHPGLPHDGRGPVRPSCSDSPSTLVESGRDSGWLVGSELAFTGDASNAGRILTRQTLTQPLLWAVMRYAFLQFT